MSITYDLGLRDDREPEEEKSMSEHTPGPWKCEWDDEDINDIEGTYKVYPIPRDPTFGGLHDQYQANAHLIAAAPDLLDALERAKGAVEWMAGATDSDPEDHELLELVNKAIAKAKPKQ